MPSGAKCPVAGIGSSFVIHMKKKNEISTYPTNYEWSL